jgi:hypothetical protein
MRSEIIFCHYCRQLRRRYADSYRLKEAQERKAATAKTRAVRRNRKTATKQVPLPNSEGSP